MKEARIRRFLKTRFERQTVCFSIFVIFLLFYNHFVRIYKPSEVVFFLLLFFCLIIYLTIFKYLYLIKNAFLLGDGERKPVVIGTIFWIAIFLIIGAMRKGSFAPISNISIDILFNTLVEELVFRAFLLGMLIEEIPLSEVKPSLYFTENEKGIVKMFCGIIIISILFSLLHADWWYHEHLTRLFTHFLHSFIFSVVFVFTNKKIYAPWLIHYVNNVFYLG